jgi:hypothetical protein
LGDDGAKITAPSELSVGDQVKVEVRRWHGADQSRIPSSGLEAVA